MATLGLSAEVIIESQYKEYIETLPENDGGNPDVKTKDKFIEGMKDAVGNFIDQKIQEMNQMITSVIDGANNVIQSATSMSAAATGIATPDPMAPNAAKSLVLNIKSGVASARASLGTLTMTLNMLLAALTLLRVPIPAIIATANALLSSANSALNLIPI
jgi:hypothetical protein